LGSIGEMTVTAIARAPKAVKAAWERKELSTPPE
jgi:hypothetical protein